MKASTIILCTFVLLAIVISVSALQSHEHEQGQLNAMATPAEKTTEKAAVTTTTKTAAKEKATPKANKKVAGGKAKKDKKSKKANKKSVCRGKLPDCRVFDSMYYSWVAGHSSAKKTFPVPATRRFMFNEKTGKVTAFQKGWGKPTRHASKNHSKRYKKFGKKSKKAKKGKKGAKAAKGAKKDAKPQLKAKKTETKKAGAKSATAGKKGGKKAGKGATGGKKGKGKKGGKKDKKAGLAASFKKMISLVKDGSFEGADPIRVFNSTYFVDVHDSRSSSNGAERDRFVGITISRRSFIVAERLFNNKNKWLIATADADGVADANGFVKLFASINSKSAKKLKKVKPAKKAKKAKKSKKDAKKGGKKSNKGTGAKKAAATKKATL